MALGDLVNAERDLSECLRCCRAVENSWASVQIMEMFGWLAAVKQDPRRAVVLVAASAAVSRATGYASPTMTLLGPFHDECDRGARALLTEADYERASREGDSMTFDQAADFALGPCA